MRLYTKIFNTLLLLGLATSLSANKASMLSDLHSIHSIFSEHYAPKEWKESHLGWNLSLELHNAERKIGAKNNITAKDFQIIVKDFLRSTQDYHVGTHLQSTERSNLPFTVKSSQGRFFIYSIDTERFDTKSFKIKIGDELISLDGKPVSEISKEIVEKISRGVVDTDQALADHIITTRKGSEGIEVPKGPVKVKVVDKNTGQEKIYQMFWQYKPEYYTFHREILKKRNKGLAIDPMMVAADWILEFGKKNKRHLIDGKKSDLPKLGEVIWKNDSDNYFQAYIFRTKEGENVGFFRLHTYMPESWDPEVEMEELVEILTKFESSTTKLVIDQTNNGGGSVFYLYSIASLFAKEPLKTPKEKVMMNPDFVKDCRIALKFMEQFQTNKEVEEAFDSDDFMGLKPTMQLVEALKNYYRFIINEWESGKNLTDPFYLYAIDEINPHPDIVYTKPILLLVNELDFSCGDFFPALMQDNKRAVLMGNRTSGAGGCVSGHFFLSNNGINVISYTWTIAERNGNSAPIENLGITPDIEYKITPADLQYGFKGYRTAILEALRAMDEPEQEDMSDETVIF